MSIFKLTLKHKTKLIRSDYIQYDKPTIYAFSHVFKDDIVSVLSCLKSSAYILMANKEGITKTFDGLGAFLNGAIWVDRTDKKSRIKATDMMVEVLQNGGDILMAPEASWNVIPNLPIKKLWWGVLDVAANTGANIVPVAIDIVNDQYCVLIGRKYDYNKYNEKSEAISLLRDEMATLSWELFERKPLQSRSETSDLEWVCFYLSELARVPFVDQIIEDNASFRPKGEIDLGELLTEMHGIEYRSLVADYTRHMRINSLIDDWTNPIRFTVTNIY